MTRDAGKADDILSPGAADGRPDAGAVWTPEAIRNDPGGWRSAFDTHGFAVCAGGLQGETLARVRRHVARLTDANCIPAEARALVDLEPECLDGHPVVQRVRKPNLADPYFFDLARSPALLALVEPILGADIRLHHGKINVKAPRVGSPLEWHQDWAFIPHTNDSLAIVSVMIDDCTHASGPLQLLPGSHRGPLHAHHHDGMFVGAIDPAELDLRDAHAVTGDAGTVAVHHPMCVHGSGFNVGTGPRRVLFFEYAAADAWPLFYGVDWHDFNARMVCGRSTAQPRLERVFVRMPYPSASEAQGRIYDQQRSFSKRHFESRLAGTAPRDA
ncbi:MAG: phytanoyl-CoA dioxygenase family protein [Lautropia sp.]